MIAVLVLLALVGPPKLPPIGPRAVPPAVTEVADEEPAPTEPAAVPEAPPAPPPPPAKPSTTPSAPPVVETKTAAPPPGPEVLANGPTGTTSIARLPGGPGTVVKPGGALPLRVVSTDEVSRWDREGAATKASIDAKPAAAKIEAEPTVVRTAAPIDDGRPRFRRGPHPPDRSAAFVLGYRYFRIQDALGRAQDWHLASIEVTPMRRYVRLNLLTEFGVEGGEAAAAGDRADILLMERLGIGMQYPHVVTPFVEFQGGVGGARVELFGRNDVTLLYSLGLDLGAQWAVGRWMFVHAAVGWIRPTFVWPERTLSYDRVALKLGLGF